MNFVIHWNETAMGLHVFPIPIPPPPSLSTQAFLFKRFFSIMVYPWVRGKGKGLSMSTLFARVGHDSATKPPPIPLEPLSQHSKPISNEGQVPSALLCTSFCPTVIHGSELKNIL